MENLLELFNKLKGERLEVLPEKGTPEGMATVQVVAEEFHKAGYGGVPLKEIAVLELLPDPNLQETSVGFIVVGPTNFTEIRYKPETQNWGYLLESPFPGLLPNKFLEPSEVDQQDFDEGNIVPFTEDTITFSMNEFILIDAIAGWRNGFLDTDEEAKEFLEEQETYLKMYRGDAQRIKDGEEGIGPDLEKWEAIWAAEEQN